MNWGSESQDEEAQSEQMPKLDVGHQNKKGGCHYKIGRNPPSARSDQGGQWGFASSLVIFHSCQFWRVIKSQWIDLPKGQF